MKSNFATAYAVSKRQKMCSGGQMMAEGGPVETHEGYQSECDEHCNHPGEPHPKASGYEAHEGDDVKHNAGAMSEDDMVARIIEKKKMFSKGGMVANDTPPTADEQDADYDYLAKNDELESHYTGSNSGDELGDEYDSNHHDMVSQVMMKRRKQRNPSPA